MSEPHSRHGAALYRSLPEIYRSRDDQGHLADYLDALGGLLDGLQGTLEQRLADSFPDRPADGGGGAAACQEWLLPYFARLLDVQLRSADADGRREEVARAVSWRQRKGTLRAVEEVAEALLRRPVTVREGWKRLLLTARPGVPPDEACGDLRGLDPVTVARVPGLPRATLDLRPGAVPRAELPRTLDLRRGDPRRGHHHPRRLTVHLEPPAGLFAPGWEAAAEPEEVRIAGDGEAPEVIEGRIFPGTLITTGRVTLRRCAVRRLVAAGEVEAEACLLGEVAGPGADLRLIYTTVLGELRGGRLWASDSLLAGEVELTRPREGCLRYSRVPAELLSGWSDRAGLTDARPLFLAGADGFGKAGCGVLHPAAPAALRGGAEDGGELGAFHDRHYCRQWDAAEEKLAEFLPLGMEVVLGFGG